MENLIKVAGLTVISYLNKLIFFDRSIDSNNEDSDEEMELYLHRLKVRINNAVTKPHRIEGFIERVVDMSTASEFQSHFRITVTSFEWLLNRIAPLLESARAAGHQTRDPKIQLLSFLWLLATPDSFRSVGCSFDLGKSTLSAIFMRVVTALNEISPEIIFWPNREER
ncbi:PREDICTED: uncharacterized protein LOC108771324 [Cyphomyrmex costatus]|nr:PREDICTED: uncharacterized protein LOC108771324 [Cyphomyrmex costatus]